MATKAHTVAYSNLELSASLPLRTPESPVISSFVRERLRYTFGLIGLTVAFASPLSGQVARRFDSGIVLSGAWLQANALPLDREAPHSAAIDASYRWNRWSVEAGFLRIARDLTTIQGGSAAFGRMFRWRAVQFIPAVGVFLGQALSSRDTTGYDWVSGGTSGHTPRYSYSEGATFGGSAGLTIEVPVYRWIAVRGTASEWVFSGAPLEGDRTRTLLGVGLALQVR